MFRRFPKGSILIFSRKIFAKKICTLRKSAYLCSPIRKKRINNRGVAQLASASGLGPEGPVFESQYPDIKKDNFNGAVLFYFFIRLFLTELTPYPHLYGRHGRGLPYGTG